MPPSASFQGRRPPVSIESEQAVLGSILLDNRAYQKAADIIAEDHFAEPVHRAMWHVLAGIIEKGDLATPLTAKTYLGDADLGKGVTVGEYLARLCVCGVSVSQVADHAKIVRSLAARREIIAMTERVAGVAYDCPVEETAETIFANVERLIEETRPAVTKDQSDFEDFGGISSQDVFDAYQRGAGVVGLSTGLPALDAGMGGLRKSDLIILAGRPGTGKTSLSTNIAVAVARFIAHQHAAGVRMGPVAFSSLEMGKRQLKQRILADQSRVPFWKLDRGIADKAEMERYVLAERAFDKLPLLIDDTGGLTIGQLKLRARTLKRRRGISLLVIDYLQLLAGTGRRDGNRALEIAEITVGLKGLAKELDIPIIALSQLSRKVEERDDKRPQLADLRECVTGDTLLTDANTGRQIAIREVRPGMKVLGLTPGMKVAAGPVGDVWSTGVKSIFRVTTRTGRVLRATENHPFLTGRGWQPLRGLRPDDRLAVPYRSASYGKEKPHRADLCRLLGYMAGNGSMQHSRTLGLIIPDEDAFADACGIINAEWPDVQIKLRANGYNDAWISRTYENGHGMPFGNPMREWLRSLGLVGERDSTKHVPSYVFEAGEIGARNFLAGYLATDGCVTNTGDRWSIRFDTTSHDLAQGVVSLLTRLGIAAAIGRPTLSALSTKGLYRVSVCQSPENLQRFAEQVKPFGARGQRIDAMLAGMTGRATRNSIFVLPAAIATYASANYPFRDQDKALSRQKATELLRDRHDDVLAAYCESDLIWDEIRSIEPCGEEEVFDISIPGLNCFVANGIVVHNSGAIEQDADVVLFVYREEYYLKKAEPRVDGSEQKREAHARWESLMKRWAGCAEVIIGKNRHGSEGTVDLGFDAQFTRFTNEPEPREIEPEEVRQRAAKKPTFTAEGTILYGILKSLTLTRSSIATNEQRSADRRLCKGARLVDLDVARAAFGSEVLPEVDEDTVKKRFQAAFISIRKAGIAHYHGSAETGFSLWLPELVADV